GKYIAGLGTGGAVEVWSFESGKLAARLPAEAWSGQPAFEFVKSDALLVAWNAEGGAQCKVWTLGDQPTARKIELPPGVSFDTAMFEVSPGRKFLALCIKGVLWLVDLESGELCGSVQLPAGVAQHAIGTTQGIAFSDDGKDVAVLQDKFGRDLELSIYHMADGTSAGNNSIRVQTEWQRHFDQGIALIGLPDAAGWMVQGHAMVDRQGQVWPIGLATTENFFRDKVKVLGIADHDHLIVASNQMLTTWKIPRDASGNIKMSTMQMTKSDFPTAVLADDRPKFPPGFRDPFAPAAPVGENFEQTSRSYRSTMQLNALCTDDKTLLSSLHWYPAKKQPMLGIRFGIGVQRVGKQVSQPLTDLDQLAKLTGPIGPTFVKELQSRQDDGSFGNWPAGDDPRLQKVILMGVASRSELLAGARSGGLDAAVIFELTDEPIGLTKRTETSLRIRILDISGDPQWSSSALKSSQLAQQQAGDTSLVDKFVGDAVKQVDAQFKLLAMPEMKPEVVKTRVDKLTANKDKLGDVLNVLAELRYYQIKGLLAADAAQAAYKNWLKDDAAHALATGSPAERRTALEAWLKTASTPTIIRRDVGNNTSGGKAAE
ncbi:MAG TPA: hypothetical protein VGJ15_11075, partial [Pirellulales bacterium]